MPYGINPIEQGTAQDWPAAAYLPAPPESYYNGNSIGEFFQNQINSVIPSSIRNNPVTEAVVDPINRVGQALQQTFDDPSKLTLGDIASVVNPTYGGLITSDVEHPQDAVVQAAIVGSVAAAPYVASLGVSGVGTALSGVGSIAAGIGALLKKGKDTINTILDNVKNVLGTSKLPSLDSLSNFKLPSLGNLNLNSLGNLGKLSIPPQLKDALSGAIPVHAAPAQFQSAPDAIPNEAPTSGPSPLLIGGGIIGIGLLIYLMRKS